ncbi:hypothetical protein C8P63_12640 [Melghirimyces profundicolus]|uniref:Uncharacterized protein n=1 Tax=Melghirimyces profundicolus TaxID=1242148 RepID=A0A2T6BCJ1_9BACL|nr:hypothetical protein [Melghirimyces profundicolus]PTX53752.1 hypothetical protein C8P63_12640 [Melghirimyces profundicolus]
MEWVKGYVIIPWNSILGRSKPPIQKRFIRFTNRYALVDRTTKGLVKNYHSAEEAMFDASVRYARELHNYHVDARKWRPAAIELASRFYAPEVLARMSDKELGSLVHNTDWHQKRKHGKKKVASE